MSSPAQSPASSGPLPPLERLTLAEEALVHYRTSCFWFLDPDFQVTEETLPLIIHGLRRHGDRAAFQLAARLSQQPEARITLAG